MAIDDAIRMKVEQQTGQRMLRFQEVANIVWNLAHSVISIGESTIRSHLDQVPGAKMRFEKRCLYRADKVFEYLQTLEKDGKISLRQQLVTGIEDLLELEYHLRRPRLPSSDTPAYLAYPPRSYRR